MTLTIEPRARRSGKSTEAREASEAADDIELELIEHHQHGAANTARAKLASFQRPEHTELKVKYPYYDFGPLLSCNAVVHMAVGGRGIGKTYGAKKLAIKKNIKTGEQFIYLRRYEEELIVRETFFADIAHEFPDWDFRANGNTFEKSPVSQRDDKRREWSTMGYLVALSTAQKRKSISYHKVKWIIFDEFILEKGFVRYITDEANVFLNFFSTVDRGQDKTRVIMIANAVAMMNPYMIAWGVSPEGDDIKNYMPNPDTGLPFLSVHFPKSAEFAAVFYRTRLGAFVKDTDWAKYAVGNEFTDNRKALVRPKNPNAKFQFNLETKFGRVSVWHDLARNEYWIGTKIVPNQRMYTMVPEKMDEGKFLLLYNDDVIVRMRTGYRMDRMRFQDAHAENVFIDLFNKKQ